MARQKKWDHRGDGRGDPRLLNRTVTMKRATVAAAATAGSFINNINNEILSVSSLDTTSLRGTPSIISTSSTTGRGSMFSRKKLNKKVLQNQKKEEEGKEEAYCDDFLDTKNADKPNFQEASVGSTSSNTSKHGSMRMGQHKVFHPVQDPKIASHARRALTGRSNHLLFLFGNTNHSHETLPTEDEGDSDGEDDDDGEEENSKNIKSKQEEDDEEQDRAAAEIEKKMEKETGLGLEPMEELGNSKATLLSLEPLTSSAEFRRPAPIEPEEEERKFEDTDQIDPKTTIAVEKHQQIAKTIDDDDGSNVVVFEDDSVDRSGDITEDEYEDSSKESRPTPRFASHEEHATSDFENLSSGSKDRLRPTTEEEDYDSDAPAKTIQFETQTKVKPSSSSWMAALTSQPHPHAEHRVKAAVKRAMLEQKRKTFPIVVKSDSHNWREKTEGEKYFSGFPTVILESSLYDDDDELLTRL